MEFGPGPFNWYGQGHCDSSLIDNAVLAKGGAVLTSRQRELQVTGIDATPVQLCCLHCTDDHAPSIVQLVLHSSWEFPRKSLLVCVSFLLFLMIIVDAETLWHLLVPVRSISHKPVLSFHNIADRKSVV